MDEINVEHRNQYALITGATSGIGYELAKLFAADGFNLVLVARNKERLNEVTNDLKQRYSVEITPLAKNLFDVSAAKEIYNKTREMGIQINVLVNDAGQGEWGPFTETALERDLDIIRLNTMSLVALTKYFVKDMVKRNEGKILQLGSAVGTTPSPLLSIYAATKAFVLSFSAALANELKDTQITVTTLMPGPTDTDFFHKAHMKHAVTCKEKLLSPPEEVARDGYEALMKGKNRIISGTKTKVDVFMSDVTETDKSAKNIRKQMETSEEENGRMQSAHAASQKERQTINAETGNSDGDYYNYIPEKMEAETALPEIKPF